MNRLREAWKDKVLSHIRNGASLVIAAKLTNVGLDRVIYAKNHDSEFAENLQAAEDSKKKQATA